MKIALAHDWLIRLGGAERVLISLHKIFPEAPIYTLFYDQKFVSQYLSKAKIIPSFLQKVPNIKRLHSWFKILMPTAVESLDLSSFDPAERGFDIVISSSHEFSHGVLVKQKTRHICFYHSPSRILWDRAHEYVNDFRERGRGHFKLSLIRLGQHLLRLWDYGAAKRPDIVLANSKYVAERIKKYYGREARVIYPPVSRERPIREKPLGYSHFGNARRTGTFDSLILGRSSGALRGRRPFFPPLAEPSKNGLRIRSPKIPVRLTNYFLIVSQLYPHKNIDLAVEAFKNLPDLDLLIIGEGPEKKRLRKLIGDSVNIKLLGFVSDEELIVYYENCLAYLICNEEDFGISPVEAMSFGKPVLALRQGGAAETVLEGITGEFFDPIRGKGTLRALAASNGVDGLIKAIQSISEKIKNNHYDLVTIKKHSEKFGFERFKKEILDLINSLDYIDKNRYNYVTREK